MPVCGADPGDEPGGLDCPVCHEVMLDSCARDGDGWEIATGCVCPTCSEVF